MSSHEYKCCILFAFQKDLYSGVEGDAEPAGEAADSGAQTQEELLAHPAHAHSPIASPHLLRKSTARHHDKEARTEGGAPEVKDHDPDERIGSAGDVAPTPHYHLSCDILPCPCSVHGKVTVTDRANKEHEPSTKNMKHSCKHIKDKAAEKLKGFFIEKERKKLSTPGTVNQAEEDDNEQDSFELVKARHLKSLAMERHGDGSNSDAAGAGKSGEDASPQYSDDIPERDVNAEPRSSSQRQKPSTGRNFVADVNRAANTETTGKDNEEMQFSLTEVSDVDTTELTNGEGKQNRGESREERLPVSPKKKRDKKKKKVFNGRGGGAATLPQPVSHSSPKQQLSHTVGQVNDLALCVQWYLRFKTPSI